MNIKMPKNVEMIIEKLILNGYEAYAVGGCIRDSIMGIEPKDWDICTSALPEETKNIFKDYRIIETGIKHGTVTILIEKQMYEVTTFRIDGIYQDNRHPESVTFVSAVKEDLARRDLTINALAYNNRSGIIDYFGGLQDLKNKKISCVGNADKRFNEDALRILRAIRFSAVYGFDIKEETDNSIHQNAYLIANISNERINAELNKILLSDKPSDILLKYSDVIGIFIPEIKVCVGFNQRNRHHKYDVWEHISRTVDNIEPILTLRLAMMLHDIAKPLCAVKGENGEYHFPNHNEVGAKMVFNILKRLKYPNSIIKECVELVRVHDMTLSDNKKGVRRHICKFGKEFLYNLVKVKYADISAQSYYKRQNKIKKLQSFTEILNELVMEENCFSLKDMNINGKDIKSLGIKEGKEIGIILSQLFSMIIDGNLENNHEKLLNQAEKIISQKQN